MPPLDTELKQYKAIIEAVDTELGRLMQQVDLNKTVVILVGDNGTIGGFTASSPSGRSRGTLYEGGINVPLIVAGKPAVRPPDEGEVSDALVNLVDVYATIAELAGIDLAAVLPPDHELDSVSSMFLMEELSPDQPSEPCGI